MKQFYRLAELAEERKVKEEEIFFLASEQKIVLSIWWSGWAVYGKGVLSDWTFLDEFLNVPWNCMSGILSHDPLESPGDIIIREACRADGTKVRLHYSLEDTEGFTVTAGGFLDTSGRVTPRKAIIPPAINRAQFFILAGEVARFEANGQRDDVPTDEDLIEGKIKICRALGLGDKSFNAAKTKVERAGLEFGRKIPGDKNSSPTLKTSEIVKIQSLSKKSTPKSKKNI